MNARRYFTLLILTTVVGTATAQCPPSGIGPGVLTDRGTGSTFVLVTGFVGGIGGLQRLEQRLLDRGHRVIVIDPFHMSLDSTDASFSAIAKRVEAVLAERNVIGAHIVAHSHGSGVAMRVAASAPDRVSALTLMEVGTQFTPKGPMTRFAMRIAPTLAKIPGGKAILRHQVTEGVRSNVGSDSWFDEPKRKAYAGLFLDCLDRAMAFSRRMSSSKDQLPVDSIVARLRIPVTLILGDAPHESAPTASEINLLTPLGTQLRVHHLKGVGYFPHEEAPDEVVRIIGGTR